MRELKRCAPARVPSAGHALVQNLHRGHDDLATDIDPRHQIPQAAWNSSSPSELSILAELNLAHHATTNSALQQPSAPSRPPPTCPNDDPAVVPLPPTRIKRHHAVAGLINEYRRAG